MKDYIVNIYVYKPFLEKCIILIERIFILTRGKLNSKYSCLTKIHSILIAHIAIFLSYLLSLI